MDDPFGPLCPKGPGGRQLLAGLIQKANKIIYYKAIKVVECRVKFIQKRDLFVVCENLKSIYLNNHFRPAPMVLKLT